MVLGCGEQVRGGPRSAPRRRFGCCAAEALKEICAHGALATAPCFLGTVRCGQGWLGDGVQPSAGISQPGELASSSQPTSVLALAASLCPERARRTFGWAVADTLRPSRSH